MDDLRSDALLDPDRPHGDHIQRAEGRSDEGHDQLSRRFGRTEGLWPQHATLTSWWLPSGSVRDNITPVSGPRERRGVRLADAEAGLVDVIIMEKPMMSYWMSTDPWAVTVDLVLSPPFATMPGWRGHALRYLLTRCRRWS